MASNPGQSGGAALGPEVVRDSNPASDSLRYRRLLKEIDNGIGEREMDKLRYLCQDVGVASRKFEKMKRGIELFAELETLALITPDDISLLTALMEAIRRYDLAKKLRAWSLKEGGLARRLSAYRKLMLKISESLSKDEREQLEFFLRGDENLFPVSVLEQCKTVLQLFTQMENYTLIGPNDLSKLVSILSDIGNQLIVRDIQKYQREASMMTTSSSSPSLHSSGTTPSFQPKMESSSYYNSAATASYWRTNSDPSFNPLAGSCGSVGSSGSQFSGAYPPGQQQWHQSGQQYGQQGYVKQEQHGWQQHGQYQQHLPQPQQPVQPMSGQYSQQQQELKLQQYQQQHQQQHGQHALSSNVGSFSTVGPQKPKGYDEAVDKYGQEHADKLLEGYMRLFPEEIEQRMRRLQISPTQSTPSTTTENVGERTEENSDNEEAMNLGEQIVETSSIETRTTTESRQGSTATQQAEKMVVPAQTAMVNPPRAADVSKKPKKPKGLPRYPMERLPRGQCIIFNAHNFGSSGLETRDGTEKDVERLLNTFDNNLQFTCHVKDDPTSRDYITKLQDFQKMDHSKCDAFVCIILSHGSNGTVCGSDGEHVAIDALTSMFRGEYVPTLVGKPKIFFIQACQGIAPQRSVEIRQDATTSLPNESDTLVSLSTVPGYSSNRSISKGTWFITTLCYILNRHWFKEVDLLAMLTVVNDELSAVTDREGMKQIGNPSHTLRKQVFFNDGTGRVFHERVRKLVYESEQIALGQQ